MIVERAPAKVNLVLHVGPRRADGLHELASLFASLSLHDVVSVAASPTGGDEVVCPGVTGPNLAAAALRRLPGREAGAAFRRCGWRSRSGSPWPRGWAAEAPTPPPCCAPRTASRARRSTRRGCGAWGWPSGPTCRARWRRGTRS